MDQALIFIKEYINNNEAYEDDQVLLVLLRSFEKDGKSFSALKKYVESLNDDILLDVLEDLAKYLPKEDKIKLSTPYIYPVNNKTAKNSYKKKIDNLNKNSYNDKYKYDYYNDIDWDNDSFDIKESITKPNTKEYLSYDSDEELSNNSNNNNKYNYKNNHNNKYENNDEVIVQVLSEEYEQQQILLELQMREEERLDEEERKNQKMIFEQVTQNPVFDCIICTDSYDKYNMYKIQDCKHRYCYDCIRGHINSKISEAQYNIKCPEPKCKTIINQVEIQLLCGDEVSNKVAAFTLTQLISSANEFFVRCPNSKCDNVVYNDEDVAEFKCVKCNFHYCLKCQIPYHSGSSCEAFKSWKKDNDNADKEFENIVKDKLWKKCVNAKCGAIVEKSQGCNHMTCRCGAHFCYRCGGNYPCANANCSK